METLFGQFLSNEHGAQDGAMKHVEYPHKTRMQILSPGANNFTLREKFIAQDIFSYHGKRRLWQHICLNLYVMDGELSVWVNGNFERASTRLPVPK